MARLATVAALVALLAGSAAAQNLNLNLVKGTGGSLTPASVVGSYRGPVASNEFATIASKDKSGFLSTYGFTFTNSQPSNPGFIYNFANDGNFEFVGDLLINGVLTPTTLTGAFRLFVW